MTESIKNQIWVYGDLRNQRHFNFSLNALAAGHGIAEKLGGKTVAVLPKLSASLPELNFVKIDRAIELCLNHGADYVYVLEQAELSSMRTDIHAQVLHAAIQIRCPRAVLFVLTDFSREIAARCARLSNAGLIADCTDFRIEDQNIVAACPSWGGEIMADLTFADSSRISFATVQPHAFKSQTRKGVPGKVENIAVDAVEFHPRLKQISFAEEAAGQRKLEEADIVVAGGAGLGSADGFGLARELSAAIGGEIAGTRPAVINHWIDEERMIGQTGKTVRPELLFSIGTSGAVQYTVGIMEADTIVAINRDADAPIFEVADYGIVADAKVFLPILTAKLKQVVMRKLADALSDTKERDEAGTGFGEKLRKIRESHQWTVEEMAQQTGQTPETIRQVESDGVVPSVSFLLKLSRALNVDPGTFLRDEEKSAIKDRRAQAFVQRAKSFNYQTLTPGAENEHLRGFMITIEPYQDHKPVALKHEGEEFVYVMEGDLELTLDNKKSHLKPGESMHFNSETPHKMKSLSKETTRCLVVLYTP